MLEFHVPTQEPVPAAELVEILELFRDTLQREGMASMDEYGDMLSWPLPTKDGWGRTLHVFHPGMCSYSDEHYGTVHYHGGTIRGTVLHGHLLHDTYEATPDPAGTRFYQDKPYTLRRTTVEHGAGYRYQLPAHVAHWIRPTTLTLTLFDEEDNGELGDLINPATKETDEFQWEQEHADAILPELLAIIQERMQGLTLRA